MSQEKVKELLARLREELEHVGDVDEETLALVRGLDDDIHRLVDPDSEDDDVDSVLDKANAVEARFAVEYPVAERFLREIIDALAKVGI